MLYLRIGVEGRYIRWSAGQFPTSAPNRLTELNSTNSCSLDSRFYDYEWVDRWRCAALYLLSGTLTVLHLLPWQHVPLPPLVVAQYTRDKGSEVWRMQLPHYHQSYLALTLSTNHRPGNYFTWPNKQASQRGESQIMWLFTAAASTLAHDPRCNWLWSTQLCLQ